MRRLAPLALILAGCSGEASHIPSPVQLPGAFISSSVENARYEARRNRVKSLIKTEYDSLRRDGMAGGGPTLNRAMDAANIPQSRRDAVIADIARDPALYFGSADREKNIEAITVTLMVNGD